MPVSPFAMLADLLDGVEPGMEPINLTVGEPGHDMPDFLMDALAEAKDGFAKYPPIRGSDEFRAAVAAWLGRRYPPLAGLDETALGIIPLAGTREGLFHIAFSARARRKDLDRPTLLIPNPFYHTYAGAAQASGVEAEFLNAGPGTGFLPDLDAIDAEVYARTAAFFLCSPANPQGTVASRDYLVKAIGLARKHDFQLIADECYSEVYTQDPPPGALEMAQGTTGSLANVVSMQSLSKRSNLPGLRAGFCAGDPEFVEAFASFRNVVAPQMPLPVQHACARLLGDEAHVDASRALYREKFDAADAFIGNRFGYRRPGGGFFLWLDVSQHGTSESVVKTLWREGGVKVLPGKFLARDGKDGTNPGEGFIRVAMVADLETTKEALRRIVVVLT